MAVAARFPRPLRLAVVGQAPFLEVERDDEIALLDWLGLGRAEFGAIQTSNRPAPFAPSAVVGSGPSGGTSCPS
jgi:hypothetical protein